MTYLEIAERLHSREFYRITDAPLTDEQFSRLAYWTVTYRSGAAFFESPRHRMFFVLFVAAAEGEI